MSHRRAPSSVSSISSSLGSLFPQSTHYSLLCLSLLPLSSQIKCFLIGDYGTKEVYMIREGPKFLFHLCCRSTPYGFNLYNTGLF